MNLTLIRRNVMCGGTPSAPPPPPKVPEAPSLPEDGRSTSSADADKRRRARAGGQSQGGTILTSASGVQNGAAAATKTLLGQ